jgi:2-keto-4-pentenoate hydratase/2-oxohepta-3-ene-1,7-dioic acid hydratase in catechol pathway
MKIVRFDQDGGKYGELRGDQITPLKGELGAFEPSGEADIPLASVRLLAPVVPGKIVAVGPNYHANMQGAPHPPRPYLWIKPATALNHPEGEIHMPDDVPAVCHESELAIVIGRKANDVSVADAPDYIYGYTCINDVTAGSLDDMAAHVQSQYFVDGKIYDSFAPIGPVIVTDLDTRDLRVQCRVNGEIRQDHRTSDQIWRPAELIAYISSVLTLNPGDVIATGSPPNPGPFAAGDILEVEVEGIGILRNTAVRKNVV